MRVALAVTVWGKESAGPALRVGDCVKALGGKLKIVADFGDETYVLG